MKAKVFFMFFVVILFAWNSGMSQTGKDKKAEDPGVGMNKKENRVTIRAGDATQKGVKVDTQSIAEIIGNAAVCKYSVKLKDPAVFVEQGVCWGKTSGPEISGSKAALSTYTETVVNGEMTGLDKETKYYVRAYLTTSSGTVYGKELSFTTTSDTPDTGYWIRRR